MEVRNNIGRLIRASLAMALITVSSTAMAVTVDLLVLYDSYSSNYFSNQPETAMQRVVRNQAKKSVSFLLTKHPTVDVRSRRSPLVNRHWQP